MRKLMFALLGLAISLIGTQCWAQCEVPPCAPSITNTFSPDPGNNEHVYDFTSTGDGILVVHFVRVLTRFTLTVTVDHNIDALDPTVFDPSTTHCVVYAFNHGGGGQCDEYDFTGTAIPGGPNGVPVRGQDYRGLIRLRLSYFAPQIADSPAFLHAPGDNATAVYSEDILTDYSPLPPCGVFCEDPTMDGTLPGLSTVSPFHKKLNEDDKFCFVSPKDGDKFAVGHEIEVAFRLTGPGTDCRTADPIRDKDARVSLSTIDPTTGHAVFPALRNKEHGNKFHFDHEDGVNELDLSTAGLAPGSYTITVRSDEFSPQSVDITLTPRTDSDDPD